ncbi:MAG: hypothetical protein V4793_33240 [Paraburkholderia tropica]
MTTTLILLKLHFGRQFARANWLASRLDERYGGNQHRALANKNQSGLLHHFAKRVVCEMHYFHKAWSKTNKANRWQLK